MASRTGMFRAGSHLRYLSIAWVLCVVALAFTSGVLHVQAAALTAHMAPTGGTNATLNTPAAITPGNISAIDSIETPTSSYATYTWPATLTDYNENKYVEYTFDSPNIPSDAVIDSVTLTHVYYYPSTAITAAKLEVWDGTVFTNVPLTLPAAQGKLATVTDTKDLTSVLSTPAKINAAKVRMLAFGNGPAPMRTSENELVMDVSYHTPLPVAADVASATAVDTPVTIGLSGTDGGGASLTYAIVQAPAKGTLGAISNGQVVYTPTGTIGTDTFTYTTNNGIEDSAPATVTVTLTHGALSSITLTPSSTTASTGSQVSLTATGYDAFGNALSDDDSTAVTLSGSGASIVTPTETLASGVAEFQASLPAAGSVDFTATAGTVTSAAATVVFSDPVIPDEPIAVPQTGVYSSAQEVTLSSDTPGTSIHYTIDGTAPDCTTPGTLYQNPITIDETETIQAIACDASNVSSGLLLSGYTIQIPAVGVRIGGGAVIVPVAAPVVPPPAPVTTPAPTQTPASTDTAPVTPAATPASTDTSDTDASKADAAAKSPVVGDPAPVVPPPAPDPDPAADTSTTPLPEQQQLSGSSLGAAAADSGMTGNQKTLVAGAVALFMVGMLYLIWHSPAKK